MEIIPAIDVMKGMVVRLIKGDPKLAKSYENLGDPVNLARRWESEGARTIHVVDLDAALGLGSNTETTENIMRSVRVSVQVGGGIRTADKARSFLNAGADRIILGSMAFEAPSILKSLINEYGENRIVVALDNRDGVVMIRGWKASTRISVFEGAKACAGLGAKLFLVTSVTRDGTMTGPDLNTLARLREMYIGIIAAGGISSLNDLLALRRINLQGVVIGKALYEGKFTLSEALGTAGQV